MNLDASTLFDTYKTAFGPALRAHQEGLKTLEALARHQFAMAGDCLDWSMAHARATTAAASPTELLARQAELNNRFGEQMRTRAGDLMKLAGEMHVAFRKAADDAAAGVTDVAARSAEAVTGKKQKAA
jgi:hypothetical protein